MVRNLWRHPPLWSKVTEKFLIGKEFTFFLHKFAHMNKELIIEAYTPEHKQKWDNFVDSSRNGTFLLRRDYMDYHSDRFTDCSLMIYTGDKLIALLPASAHGDEIRSHGGLTYGGFILDYSSSGADILNMFDNVGSYYRKRGIISLIYKPIPHIYHSQPAEEDLYALFRLNARLTTRNLATVIPMHAPNKSSRLGKRALKRAKNGRILVRETQDISEFWQIIVEDRRIRHNTTPVHTQKEITRLHSLFPHNIRLYVAESDSEILAGAVIFDTGKVLHLQYAAATQRGKELYAVDVIYHEVIFNLRPNALWFDFGTSNEDSGRYLNEGMVRHKEEFGGRSVVYDTYTLPLI